MVLAMYHSWLKWDKSTSYNFLYGLVLSQNLGKNKTQKWLFLLAFDFTIILSTWDRKSATDVSKRNGPSLYY